MKRALAVATAFLLLASACAPAGKAPAGEVSLGMSPAQVEARLGPPHRAEVGEDAQHWVYQFQAHRPGSNRAEYGRLTFRGGQLVEMDNMPGWVTSP